MKKTVVLKITSNTGKMVNLGCIVTGLYNVANWERRQAWESTGKIPNYYQQYFSLRDHSLAKLLHSHVSQQVFKVLEENYRSWFALRKKGHQEARPPMFRKKGKPSTFTITNYGFKILSDSEIQLSTKNSFGENITIRVESRPDVRISEIVKPQILQIVFKKGKITANLVHDIETSIKPANGNVLAIDLGIKNFAVTFDTTRSTRIYKGGTVSSTAYYFDKKIAALQAELPKGKHGSAAISRLYRKKNAQIKQMLHCYANDIRDYCVHNNIVQVAIGDLKGIREDANGDAKNWGNKGNIKLHSWRYAWFTSTLKYKLEEAGIDLATVSEKYTSRTCPRCGDRKRKNRFVRGSYKCLKCGYANHSDVIGAMNILQRYLDGELSPTSNPVVNNGYVVGWNVQSACTEAPVFRRG